MDFKEYKKAYIEQALAFGISTNAIDIAIEYAEHLHNRKLPIIYDQQHFFQLVGYDEAYVMAIVNQPKSFYKEYSIPKRNGDRRIIHEPLPSLKEIQTWILKYILNPGAKIFVSSVAKAYIPKQSVRDNARFHKRQKYVLCLDLKDFFDSISFQQVFSVFRNMGYSKALATLLSNICILNNSLPQGAPTSPMLSNMVFKYYDDKIFDYCKSRNIRYTRYADDLTFSGDFNCKAVVSFIRKVLSKTSFAINDNKTKFVSRGNRQEVTGVVVNEKLQTAAIYRKKIRQEVYYIIKFGVDKHLEAIEWKRPIIEYLHHLLGRINFTLTINKNDSEMRKYYEYIHSVLKEYKEE
ncbi:MAG: RNA-directed DNA polymerase [Bacteroidales bacterium]|nr:RNA-directed DNA polymerase [Bacteroidales bacterium]